MFLSDEEVSSDMLRWMLARFSNRAIHCVGSTETTLNLQLASVSFFGSHLVRAHRERAVARALNEAGLCANPSKQATLKRPERFTGGTNTVTCVEEAAKKMPH